MYSAAATACEYSIREEEGKDKWNQTKELREEVGGGKSKNRKQVQADVHILYQRRGGDKMDLERIVAILIHLLEDQENAKISYRIIPPEDGSDKKEPA